MGRIADSRLRHGHTFDVTTASGNIVAVQGGGGPEGPGPMELMLVSLATCAHTTILAVLDKMRQPYDDVRVQVDSERAEKSPRVWTDITLRYLVRGAAVEDRVVRAVEITARTCSASAMLAKATDVTEDLVQVRPVPAEETRPLRQRILRPHQSLDELVVDGESSPDAGWYAAVHDGNVVGTAGVFPESPPDTDLAGSWRVRAMAVDEDFRGLGIGDMLLDAVLDHARRGGGRHVWCSARTPSEGFYERAGFRRVGEVYEPPDVGPHVRMDLDTGLDF